MASQTSRAGGRGGPALVDRHPVVGVLLHHVRKGGRGLHPVREGGRGLHPVREGSSGWQTSSEVVSCILNENKREQAQISAIISPGGETREPSLCEL